jgi:hypothetical protein
LSEADLQNREDINSVLDEEVSCLMLHPVSWPNHGPNTELYLAEEALGLVKTLDWQVIKGPKWLGDEEDEQESDMSDDEYSNS